MKITRVKSVNLFQVSIYDYMSRNLGGTAISVKMFIRPKHERNPVLGIFVFYSIKEEL